MDKSTGSARRASTTTPNNKERPPVVVRQDSEVAFDTVVACLKEERAQYQAATRLALVRLIEAMVRAFEQLEDNPRMIARLRRHEFFLEGRHGVPEEAHRLVAHFALHAHSLDQRRHADRYGGAVQHLRSKGEPVKDVATRLAGLGSIRTMLTSARLEELGLQPELDGEPVPAKRSLHRRKQPGRLHRPPR